jgi:hypothetical protein
MKVLFLALFFTMQTKHKVHKMNASCYSSITSAQIVGKKIIPGVNGLAGSVLQKKFSDENGFYS